MTREEKCKLAIERGFTYNPETGDILYNNVKKYIYTCFNGYIILHIYFNKKLFILKGHQFSWYWVNRECVNELDHINGIRDDNRICNLRSVNRQQNNWNRARSKGFYKTSYKNSIYYIAQIRLNNKTIHIGCFDTEEKARNAYLEAKQKYHVI
jgi:hypothetical protein